jgi:3'(2'), 5'-bisphosphate nucleotidase
VSQAKDPPAVLSPEGIAYISERIRSAGQYAEAELANLTDSQIEEKAAGDFITKTDIALAHKLSVALLQHFPSSSYGVLVEDAKRLPADARDPNVSSKNQVFVVDPLDGTDNYVKRDGQYCVMIGLLVEGQPVFGWIYAPARDTLYFGGPGYGLFRQQGSQQPQLLPLTASSARTTVRILMGSRDPYRKQVEEAFDKIEWVKMGSLGLKVIHIIEGHADLYLHLERKLKIWDTAAPVALALAAGLKVCSLRGTPLRFDAARPQHDQAVIIGRSNYVDEAIRKLSGFLKEDLARGTTRS